MYIPSELLFISNILVTVLLSIAFGAIVFCWLLKRHCDFLEHQLINNDKYYEQQLEEEKNKYEMFKAIHSIDCATDKPTGNRG